MLALPVVINGAFGLRTVEYLRKMLNALPKHQKKHANWNVRQVEQLLERGGGKRGAQFPLPTPPSNDKLSIADTTL